MLLKYCPALVIESKNQHIISTYANGYRGDSADEVESDPASAPRLGITYLLGHNA